MEYLKLSHSSLSGAENCWRRFEFNKLYPRPAGSNSSFPGDVGNSLHRGYQDYLVNKDLDSAIWQMCLAYPVDQEPMQTNDFRSLEACTSTLIEMIDSNDMGEYRLATIMRPPTPEEIEAGITNKIEEPAIEVPFEIELKGVILPDGRGVKIIGYVDAFMQNVISEVYSSVDIKTHRRTLKDATASYKFSGQQVPYGMVLENILGRKVDVLEVIYYDCFVDLVKPYAKSYSFFKYSEDISDWMTGTLLKVQQIQQYMEMDHFPRCQSGCLIFNKPCYFLDICEQRDRDTVLDWMLGGVEPEEEKKFFPWISTSIEVELG